MNPTRFGEKVFVLETGLYWMAKSNLKTKDKNDSNVISIPQLVTNITLVRLSREVDQLKQKQKHMNEKAIKGILHALDYKDHYTYGHSMRVAFFCTILGKEMDLTSKEIDQLELTALCHDIGKIGVPDSVLLKPSRLTSEEFDLMKSHPEKSAEILKYFDNFEKIAIDVKYHHERYDGMGYPSRKKGDDIPLFSRIILIADTFDAMTSSRPYRKGLPHQIAFDELVKFSGTQFDPALVPLFLRGMAKEQQRSSDTFYLKFIDNKFKKDAA